eukprot:6213854-Pleurochrysis_carterae.AAC.1
MFESPRVRDVDRGTTCERRSGRGTFESVRLRKCFWGVVSFCVLRAASAGVSAVVGEAERQCPSAGASGAKRSDTAADASVASADAETGTVTGAAASAQMYHRSGYSMTSHAEKRISSRAQDSKQWCSVGVGPSSAPLSLAQTDSIV